MEKNNIHVLNIHMHVMELNQNYKPQIMRWAGRHVYIQML